MRAHLAFGLFTGALVVCCQKDDERPPPLPDCPVSQPTCRRTLPPPSMEGPGEAGATATGGRSSTGGRAGAGGVGGEAGEAGAGGAFPGAGGDGSIDLSGVVNRYLDSGFQLAGRYLEEAVLEAEGATEPSVSADWSGDGEFQLLGVLAQEPVWVSVRPARETTELLRTLRPVTDPESQVEATLVPRQLFEIGVLAQLPEPLELDDQRAQAVVFVTDAQRRRVPSVTASLPAAEVVAYAQSGIWTSEVDVGTDGSGAIAFGNISARDYPGADLRIQFGGGVNVTGTIRVAAGAVTIAEIVVR